LKLAGLEKAHGPRHMAQGAWKKLIRENHFNLPALLPAPTFLIPFFQSLILRQ
jgi:hypothetical protein